MLVVLLDIVVGVQSQAFITFGIAAPDFFRAFVCA